MKPVRLIDSKTNSKVGTSPNGNEHAVTPVSSEKVGLGVSVAHPLKLKKESGGLMKLKNTIKLKSKQFKDFSMNRKQTGSKKVGGMCGGVWIIWI